MDDTTHTNEKQEEVLEIDLDESLDGINESEAAVPEEGSQTPNSDGIVGQKQAVPNDQKAANKGRLLEDIKKLRQERRTLQSKVEELEALVKEKDGELSVTKAELNAYTKTGKLTDLQNHVKILERMLQDPVGFKEDLKKAFPNQYQMLFGNTPIAYDAKVAKEQALKTYKQKLFERQQNNHGEDLDDTDILFDLMIDAADQISNDKLAAFQRELIKQKLNSQESQQNTNTNIDTTSEDAKPTEKIQVKGNEKSTFETRVKNAIVAMVNQKASYYVDLKRMSGSDASLTDVRTKMARLADKFLNESTSVKKLLEEEDVEGVVKSVGDFIVSRIKKASQSNSGNVPSIKSSSPREEAKKTKYADMTLSEISRLPFGERLKAMSERRKLEGSKI